MRPFPSSPESRRRLLEAQRAEADALKAVEVAARARDRVQAKLDTAQAEVDVAKVALIECSGLTRAALLLAEDETDLRRIRRATRRAEGSSTSPDERH